MLAIDVRVHLNELLVERELARIHGIGDGGAYMADLDDEIALTRAAYVAAAVTEIATVRGELFGPQTG
jgi:hypothetical protein